MCQLYFDLKMYINNLIYKTIKIHWYGILVPVHFSDLFNYMENIIVLPFILIFWFKDDAKGELIPDMVSRSWKVFGKFSMWNKTFPMVIGVLPFVILSRWYIFLRDEKVPSLHSGHISEQVELFTYNLNSEILVISAEWSVKSVATLM